jgi:hypothetical protein
MLCMPLAALALMVWQYWGRNPLLVWPAIAMFALGVYVAWRGILVLLRPIESAPGEDPGGRGAPSPVAAE